MLKANLSMFVMINTDTFNDLCYLFSYTFISKRLKFYFNRNSLSILKKEKRMRRKINKSFPKKKHN